MSLNLSSLVKPSGRSVTTAQSQHLDAFCEALVELRADEKAVPLNALAVGLGTLRAILSQPAEASDDESGWRAGLVQRSFSGGSMLVLTREAESVRQELNIQLDAHSNIYALSWMRQSGGTLQDALIFRVAPGTNGLEFRMEDGKHVRGVVLPTQSDVDGWTDTPLLHEYVESSHFTETARLDANEQADHSPTTQTTSSEVSEPARASPIQDSPSRDEAVSSPPIPPTRKVPPSPPPAPTCWRCAASINPGAQFCRNCGAPVELAAPVTPTPTRAKICARCGEPLFPNNKFCESCGAPVQAALTPPPPSVRASCAHCGSSISLGAKFCRNCGKSV